MNALEAVTAGSALRPTAGAQTANAPTWRVVAAWTVAVFVGLMVGATILLAIVNGMGLLDALQHFVVGNLAIGATMTAVGTLIALRRPQLRLGWYMSGTGLACVVPMIAAQYATFALVTHRGVAPFGQASAWIAGSTWAIGFGLVLVGLPLLFPDGRPVTPAWWIAGGVGAAGVSLIVIGSAFTPGPSANLADIVNPLGVVAEWPSDAVSVGFVVAIGASAAATVSLFVRYRRGEARSRIQIRAFLAAACLLVLGETALPALAVATTGASPAPLDSITEAVLGPLLAITVGIAVLRHHLHNIDVIVNRTAVYLSMTALVAASYVLLVWYAAAALGIHSEAPQLVVTIVVAMLFHPALQRVRHGVNRLFYGERGDPYRLVTRLGDLLEGAQSTDSVLTAVVSTIREGLRLPYAQVSLTLDDGTVVHANSGTPPDELIVVPLVFGASEVGALSVAPRRPGEAMAQADRRVLVDYARQAGPAVYAARLSGELIGARARLVRARESERRRLRRDLHDGLGADLGSQAITLDAVRRMVRTDPDRTELLLVDLREQVQREVLDLRRIVNDLRPAVLDDHGLAEALTVLAERYETETMSVRVAAALPASLSAAAEVAILRIVGEAIANAARHSGAQLCTVSVRFAPDSQSIQVDVADNGRGIRHFAPRGVGLGSMRERAGELGGTVGISAAAGGGTVVSATIPLPAGAQ